MIQVKTIVCHIDFSGLSPDLLETAIQMARSFGAYVLAAGCVPIPGVRAGGYVLPDSGGVLYDVDYAQAAQQLDELVRTCRTHGVHIEPCMMSGDPPAMLLALLTRVRADVVVLSSAAKLPLIMRMNRIQETLFRNAPCPVLTLNSAALSAELRLQAPVGRRPRILVSTAFDPPSEPAVLMGMMLARHLSAEVTLLHVDPHAVEGGEDTFHLWQFLAGLSSQAQTLLSSSICPEWLEPAPKTLRRSGDPGEQIVEIATHLGADLMVIGARRPPLGVPLWPSLASRIAKAAPCPLLVAGRMALANFLSTFPPENQIPFAATG